MASSSLSLSPPRYQEEGGPGKDEIPVSESLSMVIKRMMPYWEGAIVPEIKEGKRVLIVAHGSSLRSIVKHLENLTAEVVREGEEVGTILKATFLC